MPFQEATARLQELIHRQGQVTTVLHPPSASLARVMEAAGAEAGFVGTSGVVGSYTGMEDVGTATLNECVQIAGWIARSVGFPVILDGDTGHGGIMAVRRMVEDCICEGIAGVRIDDQPIEGKRGTGTAGVEVQSRDVVLTRYRAAVDRKRELDPNFVVMAQCYVAEAANGCFEESLVRMKAYKGIAEVDWVQLHGSALCGASEAGEKRGGRAVLHNAGLHGSIALQRRIAQLRYKSFLDAAAYP